MEKHISVMLNEVLDLLNVSAGKKYIDATVGGGGHTKAILEKGGEVLGLDQDEISLEIAKKNLDACPGIFKLVNSNFSNLKKVAEQEGWVPSDGILMDLGFASFQMDNPDRGLSFSQNGPLDMRLDKTLGVTAADLVNSLPATELSRLFYEYGDEPRSAAIAKAIVQRRETKPFQETKDLASLVERVYGGVRGKVHRATRVFMALRMAVNSELVNLETALPQALEVLRPNGVLAIITFHSGEDRIIKTKFKEWEELGLAEILTKKPLTPIDAEVESNSRARSAKLRAIRKI